MNSKRKEERIKNYLSEPIKVGDLVLVQGKYLNSYTTQNRNDWESITVVGIQEDGKLELRRLSYRKNEYHGEVSVVNPNEVEVRKDILYVGVNPFVEKPWHSCCRHTGYGLGHIIFQCSNILEKNNIDANINGVDVMKYNFNPYVFNADGEKVYFQRDYCWTLEDEQLFIESMYNQMGLGTIVLRKRSYKYVDSETKNGNKEVAFYDVVDGKQRLHTILRFMNDEFCDMHGNYYSDFSKYAQRVLTNIGTIIDIMEIEEKASDDDVMRVFLNVNYSGKQMSKEHLDYVRNLYKI